MEAMLRVDGIKVGIYALHIEGIAVGEHCKRGGFRVEGAYLVAVEHKIGGESLEVNFILMLEYAPDFIVVKTVIFELVF